MQKVSYMGNGSTTEFAFNFPYFENSNVVVTKNGTAATGYDIIGTSAGLDADIPYTGGKVVFETAPSVLDSITISRQLPLSRITDYQPTEKIAPTTLNQDLNYLMEVIKDRKDELETLTTQYSEIADKESTTTLLARISAIHDEIVAIDAKITALGDISTLRQNVTDLITTTSSHTTTIASHTNTLDSHTTTLGSHTTTLGSHETTIGSHTTSIGTLDNRTTGIIDYVIESQAPTSQNNYTWYRKYKSGWVEQGGITTITVNLSAYQAQGPISISLPVAISLVNGSANISGDSGVFAADVYSTSNTNFACYIQNCANRSASFNGTVRFFVYGFSA